MRCPECDTEFSTPYAREVLRNGGYLYCPRGCRLELLLAPAVRLPKPDQIAELERMYNTETV